MSWPTGGRPAVGWSTWQAGMVVVLDNLCPDRPGLVSGYGSALVVALVSAWNGHSTRAMLEGRFRGGLPDWTCRVTGVNARWSAGVFGLYATHVVSLD